MGAGTSQTANRAAQAASSKDDRLPERAARFWTLLNSTCAIAASLLIAIAILVGCRTLPTLTPTLPAQHSIVRDQLIIYTDFPLAPDNRLLEELGELRTLVNTKLELAPSQKPIHVFLFRSAETYSSYIRSQHPDFPDRRAFFLETENRLAVYAQWGDRVAEDLRHETTHGYLHAGIGHLPLWLDEGLAEYFETPRGRGGFNETHFIELSAQMREKDWQPNLQRLEKLDDNVDSMAQLDYAESWAWVHMMLETTPERRKVLIDYLAALQRGEKPAPIFESLARLHYQPDATLRDYVASLR